ncbi:glycosyltransferase family 1 protein [Candidatus Microgenomates bacterium]|nr:MAG: glycosyltransferase family 1 protein [Candidatus Microgenomates bacterium]
MAKAGRKPKPTYTIAVDCGALSQESPDAKGGIYTIAYNLLETLGKLDTRNNYIFYSFAPIPKKLTALFGSRATNKIMWPSVGYTFRLRMALRYDDPDVFIALSQASPITSVPTLGFVYDVGFLDHPSLYKDPDRLTKNTEDLVRRSRHIITISNSSKASILKNHMIADRNISVLYPGVSAHFKPKGPKFLSTHPYFLYLGHLKKTKNVAAIIAAFAQFLKKSDKQYRLLLVGSTRDLDPRIEAAIAKYKLGEKVQIVGFVPFRDLPKYYRGAVAFISLAKSEGFGLPIVEAMSCATPVIVANQESMPEVVGKAGIVVANNTASIVAAMESLVLESTRKQLSRKSLAVARQFDWEKFTKGVLEVLYEKFKQ